MVRVELPDQLDFATYVSPITIDTPCGAVYDRFMQDQDLLALPVVEGGMPLGLINRHELIQKLAHRYGRPLYENKPISVLMDTEPLIVDRDIGIDMLNRLIVNERPSALMHGFIVTWKGRYSGIGTALSVLTAAANQSARQAHDLAGLADALSHARDAAEGASAAKSQFLATMSHEIRTPMNAILGMAYLLGRSRLDKVQREQVAVMTDAGEALLTLLNDILDLSKIESGRMDFEQTPFRLDALIESLETLWRAEAQKKALDLSFDIAADVPNTIVSDATRLRQILSNLVSNALKFTAQGRVTVMVRRHPDKARHLIFSVTDTGIGIAADVLPQLFEKFAQADSSTTRCYGGTGLGLAICRQLTNHLGGDIGCDSTPGAGARFWFHLPCLDNQQPLATAAAAQPADDATPAASGRDRLNILVVEDNFLNQAVIRAMLSEQGHVFSIANNGVEGVRAVTEDMFDLVLMDMQMPEMDGLTATRRIRAMGGIYARLPIVALTANSMAGDRERCLEAGMCDYLSKPVRAKELQDTLARCTSAAENAASALWVRQDQDQPAQHERREAR